jgi:hypothetical protein
MLLDESGSMAGYRKAVIDSFNKYLTELKNGTKRCWLSLFKFDSRPSDKQLRKVFENRNVKECYPLTFEQYAPYGGTPLYDAVGELILKTKKRLPKKAKVLFVVHTDGQENASTEFNQESVKTLIHKMENKRGWTFIYLGEGAAAWNAGYDFGIHNVANFSSGLRGQSMDKLSMTTAYFASNAKSDVAASHNLYGAAGIVDADDIDKSEAPHVASTVTESATSDESGS